MNVENTRKRFQTKNKKLARLLHIVTVEVTKMENSSQLKKLLDVFGSERRLMNFLLKLTLVFVIAQQIYFPQEHKYFHLALVFVYMILLEFFKDDHWALNEVVGFTGIILTSSIVSIVDQYVMHNLGIPYLALLILGIALTFRVIYRIQYYTIRKDHSVFAMSHQKMFEKGTSLITVLNYGIMIILLVAGLYSIYEIIF